MNSAVTEKKKNEIFILGKKFHKTQSILIHFVFFLANHQKLNNLHTH